MSWKLANLQIRVTGGRSYNAGLFAVIPAQPGYYTAMNAFRIAGIVGFLAVALGAFGAHALRPLLERNGCVAIWQTATLYHLVHAVVLLVIASRLPANSAPGLAFWLILAGIAIFSGSLYALAITNVKILGAITPLGGLSLLAGWLWLAVKGFGQA